MDEIERAVDRVDQPRVRTELAAAFLAVNGVAGKRLRQAPAYQLLDREIGGAHPVLRALGFGLERDFAQKVALGQRSGFTRETAREVGSGGELGADHAPAIGTTP